jgi:hypothetical protein
LDKVINFQYVHFNVKLNLKFIRQALTSFKKKKNLILSFLLTISTYSIFNSLKRVSVLGSILYQSKNNLNEKSIN